MKINQYLDSEFFYGLSYGVAFSAILLSGSGFFVLLGVILFVVTHVRRVMQKKGKQNV